ncbi:MULTISPECIES: flavin reductase [unclassified Sphingopyxis]|uniref:flavin reductase n=1 Tax=unclassified Sphingopyxis TaxID=2614943 RepID=UPI00285A7EF9|nr:MULTISPECIES: flavin reductase [unclassified Sphingopyxis]MDR6831711.1 flavin reductase (DIM6/NTAB) family NADH-FMN oxidoreductase RutF [Sphingopyxis sp. BE122]MDR7227453.1 flavin reductase (DIM6/NTAB) family NADH-FMN oxidoreductase RutF [Sphingopyxis sp. BE259]
MSLIDYKGFGGAVLPADMLGDDNDPAVLLIPDFGQPRGAWRAVADGLVLSGRRVVNLDLRTEGGPDQLAAHVEDLRLVLAQMGSRPVVVAARHGGWIATRALATDGVLLAGGLVLVDMPDDADAVASGIAARQTLPTLVVCGGFAPAQPSAGSDAFGAALPVGERVDIDDADLAIDADRTEALLGQLLEFLECRQPREATEFQAGSDPRTLRDAMGCFATGVTIVTAVDADGTPVGLTANSFTSVSLDPPLLLVCIANASGTAPALREAAHFGVNVLQIGQQPASNRFATRGEDRFANLPWAPGQTGVPLLGSSLVSFECQRESLHEAGDHFILVGRVVRAQFEPHRDPLLYFRGKYRRLHFA